MSAQAGRGSGGCTSSSPIGASLLLAGAAPEPTDPSTGVPVVLDGEGNPQWWMLKSAYLESRAEMADRWATFWRRLSRIGGLSESSRREALRLDAAWTAIHDAYGAFVTIAQMRFHTFSMTAGMPVNIRPDVYERQAARFERKIAELIGKEARLGARGIALLARMLDEAMCNE